MSTWVDVVRTDRWKAEEKGKAQLIITPDGHNLLRCPKCGLVGSLADHQVVVSESLVDIAPSIECWNCGYHFHVNCSRVAE